MAKTIRYEDTEQRKPITRITLFAVTMACGKCKRGKMFNCGPKVDGLTPHRCNHCNRKSSYPGEGYPRTATQLESL